MSWITHTLIVTNLLAIAKTEPVISETNQTEPTRRILGGAPAGDTRPYMVYLRPAAAHADAGWTCGGVILDARHVLTSAACVEDVSHFYVVAGTHRWVPPNDKEDQCIKNGAKKAVWKCVPKSYVFDGAELENIQWLSSDIAVVRVEEPFNFKRRARGCHYAPQAIAYNNVSAVLERPGASASIAGWGSTYGFGDLGRSSAAPRELRWAAAALQRAAACAAGWPARYHRLVRDMVCARDDAAHTMSTACAERGVDCKEMVYSNENDTDKDGPFRRHERARHWHVGAHHGARHGINGMRRYHVTAGGFCEHDHGGPLVWGAGARAVVVGVIAACLTDERTRRCRGPFLFTSVYRHRALIACALYGELDPTCRRLLRTQINQTEETMDWSQHPDGPAKSEVIFAKNSTFRSISTENEAAI